MHGPVESSHVISTEELPGDHSKYVELIESVNVSFANVQIQRSTSSNLHNQRPRAIEAHGRYCTPAFGLTFVVQAPNLLFFQDFFTKILGNIRHTTTSWLTDSVTFKVYWAPIGI